MKIRESNLLGVGNVRLIAIDYRNQTNRDDWSTNQKFIHFASLTFQGFMYIALGLLMLLILIAFFRNYFT